MTDVILTMLARDEEAVLARALRSSLHLVDGLVLLVTHGADDDPSEVLESHEKVVRRVNEELDEPLPAARIVCAHVEWQSDFGSARTRLYDLAHSTFPSASWALMLDADEEVRGRLLDTGEVVPVSRATLRGLVQQLDDAVLASDDVADAGAVVVRTSERTEHQALKLLRLGPLEIRGVVHEQPVLRDSGRAPYRIAPTPPLLIVGHDDGYRSHLPNKWLSDYLMLKNWKTFEKLDADERIMLGLSAQRASQRCRGIAESGAVAGVALTEAEVAQLHEQSRALMEEAADALDWAATWLAERQSGAPADDRRRFVATWQLARTLRALGRPQAEQVALEAWRLRPARIEPLVDLAIWWLPKKATDRADWSTTFIDLALSTVEETAAAGARDGLLVELDVYEWRAQLVKLQCELHRWGRLEREGPDRLLDRLLERDIAARCRQLLRVPSLPAEERARIEQCTQVTAYFGRTVESSPW